MFPEISRKFLINEEFLLVFFNVSIFFIICAVTNTSMYYHTLGGLAEKNLQ